MGFNFGNLQPWTDETSFELISKAVLTTDLMGKISVRTNLSAGTVAINLMDGDFAVRSRDCGLTGSEGNINFSQVNIEIVDKQVRMEVCPTQLRDYYLSYQMSPSAVQGGEEMVFEQVIADYYTKKITQYCEGFLINGDVNDANPGTATGLKAQLTASANIVPGAAAWTATTALAEALDIYDAIDESVKDREDIIMIVGPAAYRALTRNLVSANLFHYDAVNGNEIIMLPGTNCQVVKSSGLINSDFAAAGPAEFIIAGTSLDDTSSFGMFYSPADDIVKVRAYWRIGVAVHQADLFGSNGLA